MDVSTEKRQKKPKTHGLRYLPEYGIWNGIKNRCLNPNVKAYPEYGGRGITICEQWKNDFVAFYTDMGPRPSNQHSIDRIDVNGHYSPENCQWTLGNVQAWNKRFQGNRSGIRGVYENKDKWIARIRINGVNINLGTYEDKRLAQKARQDAEMRYFGRCL